ncbi:MAG: hypothetical protein IMZ71_02550, partial [Chloroflexi bacterium]|nr:hypothetical protein [Chloroflexota bacterium]
AEVIFIDSDVVVTARWGRSLAGAVRTLRESPVPTVTGAPYRPRDNGTWVERAWFAPDPQPSPKGIDGGNLPVLRSTFDALGGFREELETGEDYDLGTRARAAGFRIVQDTALQAVHLGFPETLRAFPRREMRHGQGDFRSLRTFYSSRVAMASVAGTVAAITGTILSVCLTTLGPAIVAIGGLTAVAVASAARRGGFCGGVSAVIRRILIGHVYVLARTLAVLKVGRGTRNALPTSPTPGATN